MQQRIDAFLSSLDRLAITLLAAALVVAIGIVDSVLLYDISFSVFYLAPVFVAAWYGGATIGLPICLWAAVVWLIADIGGGHPYPHPLIPIWNALVRLGFFVVVAQLLCRLRTALAQQAALAQHDPLTGLLNSRSLKERYATAALLAQRHGDAIAIGFIDLDDFKLVNDRLGHRIGDEVLVSVGSLLRDRLRGSDFAGRVGGDEFVVLLPATDLPGAQAFFTQLHRRLVERAAADRWPVGFSIGVVVCTPPPSDAEDAFAGADRLMYEVKRDGKNGLRLEAWGTGGGATT